MRIVKLIFTAVNLFSKGINAILNQLLLIAENVKFENKPRINGRIQIKNKGSIFIGNNALFNCNSRSNPVGIPHPVILCTLNERASITLGNNVGISGSSLVAASAINIGNNVLIGGGCGVWDTDFHPLDAEMRKSHPTKGAITKPIEIGDDVFIGARSIILKGVRIGKGSIVSAGTVVNKDVPDNCLAYGNPMQIKLRNK